MLGASPPGTVQPLDGDRDAVLQRLLCWLNPTTHLRQKQAHQNGKKSSCGNLPVSSFSPVLQAPWVGITPALGKKPPDIWFLAHFDLKTYKQEDLYFGKG